mgnify:CR=1 FL=1
MSTRLRCDAGIEQKRDRGGGVPFDRAVRALAIDFKLAFFAIDVAIAAATGTCVTADSDEFSDANYN